MQVGNGPGDVPVQWRQASDERLQTGGEFGDGLFQFGLGLVNLGKGDLGKSVRDEACV